MCISIFKVLSVHQCVLQSKICILFPSVTTITIKEGYNPDKFGTNNARATRPLNLRKLTGHRYTVSRLDITF